MEIESLFGLPAHPLIVHAAVVLVPLTAIGALLCLSPRIRRHLGIAVFVLSILGVVAVGLAQGSGEELEHKVDESDLVEEHAEMGTTLLPWAIVLMIGTGGLVALDLMERRRRGADTTEETPPPSWAKPAAIGLSIVMVVGALASTERVIEIGHSGAKATWEDVSSGEEGDGASGEAGERDAHESDERGEAGEQGE